jgi:apolipoprotein N-acyltransferase
MMKPVKESASPESFPPAEGPSLRVRAGRSTSYVWLFAAGLLFLFANGRDSIPIAAWLAPIFMLRFTRGGRGRRLWLAYLVLIVGWAISFRGMIPAPQPFLGIVWLVYAGIAALPYVLDRWLARRIRGFASTLVFPCAAAGLDYLTSLFPYGSWGSPAYSQYGNLPLMQVVSVTGIYGITFLTAWAASVINRSWEAGFRRSRAHVGLLAWAGGLAAILFLGGFRLLFVPSGPTVRVASLTAADIPRFPSPEIERRAYAGTLSADEMLQVREQSRLIDEDLLTRCGREADAGAKIVFWGEGNSYVLPEDEPWLMSRASELAQTKKIYLGLGNVVWHYKSKTPLENTFVLIDPNGTVIWKFLKAHPVPGGEASISMRGDGALKSAETPFGRLSCVICFDADSVQLLHQAGTIGAGLVLVPSNDWRAIDPWHSQMAIFRAVEQGFSMVRHASYGLSVAVDSQGRVLGAMDHYRTSGDRVLVADVPTSGTRTIYRAVGDLFSWLVLGAFFFLAVLAVRTR